MTLLLDFDPLRLDSPDFGSLDFGLLLDSPVLAGPDLERPALDDIVRDNHKEGTKLTKQLLADLLPDDRVLLGGEVGWQTLDGLNEVIGLNTAILL